MKLEMYANIMLCCIPAELLMSLPYTNLIDIKLQEKTLF